jgi:hypothetical protein
VKKATEGIGSTMLLVHTFILIIYHLPSALKEKPIPYTVIEFG